MKKFIAALSGILMLIPLLGVKNTHAISFPLKTTIQSESAVLVNMDTNTIVHEKNADTKQMPGPLVNIMAAALCLENCENIEEKITVDESVYSHLYNTEYPDDLRYADICNGDVLTITDLLYAMMLTSSIEASETLAYYLGDGTPDVFIEMMNDKAREIGCTSTNFTNASGMYDINQYTTARDMAKITQYALSVPLFETISTTLTYNPSVPNLQNHKTHTEWIWEHSNIMMNSENDYYYNGAHGIKTANLSAAGRNIVTMASKDGNNYLAILLKSPLSDSEGNNTYYHLDDAEKLFDWAFNNFSYKVILSNTVEIGEIPVTLADGNDYVLARPKEEFSLLWYNEIDTSLIKKDDIKWDKESVQAPVKKGERLGEVTLKYSGEELGTMELVAVSDVERSVTKYNLYAAKLFVKSKWFSKAIIVSSILCFIYILICFYVFMCYKNNSKPLKPIYAVPKIKTKKKKKTRKE